MTIPVDTNFVRSQFPALTAPETARWAHFENAGGAYPARQTIDALTGFYTSMKLQPYGSAGPTAAAGAAMDRAHARWAEALNVAPGEVMFGPSTSQNTYVLAHAFGAMLEPGSEIIVTQQDHEANSGAWRRMAEARGLTLHEWKVDPESGRLAPAGFMALLNERTRLVTFPHCSNIAGERNPVALLTEAARSVGAWSVVDGVSWAPHEIPDVGALGADIYLFSLYKVFGVHQGLMTVRSDLLDALPNQGHFFNEGERQKKLVPAGPDHAQVGASGGTLDYVEAFAAAHGIEANGLAEKTRTASAMWREREIELAAPVLSFLAGHPRVRLIGPAESGPDRAPTIAFLPERMTPAELEVALAARQIISGASHFYAYRLIEALGIDPETGVLRLSMVHYTSDEEIARVLTALDDLL